MMWNEQTQQDARRIVEAMTQRQWNAFLYAFDSLTRPATKEDLAKEQERIEKAQKAKEAQIADYTQKEKAFHEASTRVRKHLVIPERYEWSFLEVAPLFEYAFHPMAGHDEVYNIADVMFDLGFKRGMSYQQSKTAKRDNLIMKRIRHPSYRKLLEQAVESNN